MFYDEFLKLCTQKGVSPSKACADMGLANANLLKWRNGAVPRNATMLTIATYFGVPQQFLEGIPTPTDADYILPSPSESPYKAFLSTVALLNEDEIRKLTGYAIAILGER